MDKKSIEIGGEYASRDPPKQGVEFQRVKVLELVRTKWRVRWIEPNKGLEDFVKSANLIVPWKQCQPYLRDERRREALARQCDRTWRGHNDPTCSAVTTVFDTTGERHIGIGNDGSLYADPEALQRNRIGVPSPPRRAVRLHGPLRHGARAVRAWPQARRRARPGRAGDGAARHRHPAAPLGDRRSGPSQPLPRQSAQGLPSRVSASSGSGPDTTRPSPCEKPRSSA